MGRDRVQRDKRFGRPEWLVASRNHHALRNGYLYECQRNNGVGLHGVEEYHEQSVYEHRVRCWNNV